MKDYVMVPVEPTEEMLRAAVGERDLLMLESAGLSMNEQFTRVYKAMLSAAPSPQGEVAELVEKIDGLYAKATPGPWERDFDTRYEWRDREHHKEHFLTAEKKRCVAAALNIDAGMLTPDDEGRLEDLQARADLDFTAALVNAWPQIRAALVPQGESKAVEALARFGLAAIEVAREDLCDLDGGWIQDTAERLGVLVGVEVTEPCGEGCRCVEGGSFPQTCLRYSPAVEAARAVLKDTP